MPYTTEEMLEDFRKDVASLKSANAALQAVAKAAERVLANSYLDDDVINRHSSTTTACVSLRELMAALERARAAGAME